MSFDLLARIDPALVVEAECPHAESLMDRLRTI